MCRKKCCPPPKFEFACKCQKIQCNWCVRTGYKFKCFEPVCFPRKRCWF